MIINFLDEVRKPILDIVHGSIFPEVDLLGFQGLEETLSRRVVVRVPLPRHADPEVVREQRIDGVVGGVLDSPVGVMDDPCRRRAKRKGHPEGLQAKARVDVTREGMTHDSAGKQIQDHGQVHEAALDADVGDVGHPKLIGPRDRQVLREVGIDPMGMVTVGGAHPAAPGFFR